MSGFIGLNSRALFSDNILPFDGESYLIDNILSATEQKYFFDSFFAAIAWQHEVVKLYGKEITTKRKVAWYGEKAFEYKYSNSVKVAKLWTSELLALKMLIEQITDEKYNTCLLNLYHNGTEGMGWHTDAEQSLKKDGAIASLSLGANRQFQFRHQNTNTTISLLLNNGSLLLMKGKTQTYWKHRLPVAKKISEPRINLTFRTSIYY
ncbi:MAG: alpha-ketoglutarate-dependent dioxygenase AlkB [Cytophagales bacterium]|nr:MAG: alpha-ketoglutarate-dependent dioxygenase AlkB [Cytophagales bacterium]